MWNRVIIFLMCVIVLLSCTGVLAAEFYTVEEVAIGATDRNATAARSKAMHAGEKKAFNTLLQSLLPDEGDIPRISSNELKGLILSRRVKKESITASTYKGVVDFKFSKVRVTRFLKQHQLTYLKSGNTPLLVLPLLKTENGVFLWEANNQWRNVWHGASSNFFSIQIPRGDIDDITMASKHEVMAANVESLQKLASKYGVDDVVIAEASYDEEDAAVYLNTRYFDGIDLTTRQDVVRSGGGGNSLAEALGRAVAKSTQAIDAMGKEGAVAAQDTNWKILVPLQSVSDWADIRKKLAEMGAVIESVRLHALAYGQADIELESSASPPALMQDFNRVGLNISKEGDYWILTKSEF